MEREQLEHLIRAASAIVNNHDLVVVGSQSILGQFPDAPSRSKGASPHKSQKAEDDTPSP
jgi:hypothetical protein